MGADTTILQHQTMTKVISNIVYFLLFVVLTIAFYAILFFIDYSAGYFTIARVFIMGVCFFYFYKLTGHSTYLRRAKEKLNTSLHAKKGGGILIALCFFIIHLILVNVGGEKLNDKLLAMDNRETTATIKDCHLSKGKEYCVYEYTVDNRYYEIKYCNDPDNLKFKESDTTTVIYYTKFPSISKLKKELE